MTLHYNWFPILGEFRVEPTQIEFLGKLVDIPRASPEGPSAAGPAGPVQVPSLGTILSDQYLSSGRVSASVTFEDVGAPTGCEIVLGYDVERRGFVAAGIPGYDFAAFSIREWKPGEASSQTPADQPHWIPLSLGGDRSFIAPQRAYALEVSAIGSRISLAIDGVRVAAANLRSPLLVPRQVGLWCLSASSIVIRDFTVAAERPRAFVVMHFARPFDEVYADVIRDTCGEFGLETVRADEIYGPGFIVHDIVEQILRSQVVIAEITPENANVYFEVGYALALDKPIVLLARQGTKLPFDVAGLRVLFYEDTIGGKTRLQKGLQRHLQAIMGRV